MTDHPMPERPKVEPEVIPPGERGPLPRGASWVWLSSGTGRDRAVRFETRGPLASQPFGLRTAATLNELLPGRIAPPLIGQTAAL